jgi:hypothetical protein
MLMSMRRISGARRIGTPLRCRCDGLLDITASIIQKTRSDAQADSRQNHSAGILTGPHRGITIASHRDSKADKRLCSELILETDYDSARCAEALQ